MEEAPENSKESLNSAHAKGMNDSGTESNCDTGIATRQQNVDVMAKFWGKKCYSPFGRNGL